MPLWLHNASARSLALLAPLLARLNRLVPLDLGAINLMAGVRAALACAVPVLIGELSGHDELSWVAISGFWCCLSDIGGAWSERAMAMAAFTLFAALGCCLGTLIAGHTWPAVLYALAWCFAATLARVHGNAASTVGLLLCSAVLVTLGLPEGSGREALQLSALTLTGGAWAMLLSLALWRLQPYGPARKAVAQCWRAAADYAAALARMHHGDAADAGQWATLASGRRRAAREAIEKAQEVIVATRRTRAGVTEQGQRLLALLADADQVYAALIGLNELLEAASGDRSRQGDGMRRAVRLMLGRLAERVDGLAAAIEGETPQRQPALQRAAERLRQRSDAAGGSHGYAYAVELLHQVSRWIDAAFEILGKPQTRQTHLALMVEQGAKRRLRAQQILGPLRANLGFGSLAFRHSLRLAITAAAAVLATRLFDISRGYWISITAIVVLQPYMVETWRRTFDRIAGSVLGGLVAAWLLQVAGSPRQVAFLVFPLSVFAFTLRSVNYALFMLCMTPLVVLIAELFQAGGIGDAHLATLRAFDSVLGGALGLAASFLLWPSWETPQLPRQMSEAVRAHRDYLLVVLGGKPGATDPDIGAARRQSGLTSNNAEASLQRVLGERRLLSNADTGPALTVLACLRRMAGATVTLSLLPQLRAGEVAQHRYAALRRWADEALSEIAQALEARRAPAPLAPPPEQVVADVATPHTGSEVILRNELLRFRRQLEVLHEAALALGGAQSATASEPQA